MSTCMKTIPSFCFLSKFAAIYALLRSPQTWRNVNLYTLNPTRISMSGGRAGTPRASYDRTRREQESQKDREARLDRQRLRKNHLTPGQRWVTLLVIIYINRIQMWYNGLNWNITYVLDVVVITILEPAENSARLSQVFSKTVSMK